MGGRGSSGHTQQGTYTLVHGQVETLVSATAAFATEGNIPDEPGAILHVDVNSASERGVICEKQSILRL